MKKPIIILLGLLLFFNSSLFIIIYGLRIIAVTNEVTEKMQFINPDELASETVLFKIPVNDPTSGGLVQRMNESEIMVDGSLYDIACQRIVGDTVYVFCLQDTEEDALLKNVLTHYDNEGNKSPEMQYFNVLFSFLSNAMVPQVVLFTPDRIASGYYDLSQISVRSAFPEIPAPPPRFIV